MNNQQIHQEATDLTKKIENLDKKLKIVQSKCKHTHKKKESKSLSLRSWEIKTTCKTCLKVLRWEINP